jgi:hypothetical protein
MLLTAMFQIWTKNAFAIACVNGPDPNSAERLARRVYGQLFQGGIVYLADVFLIVTAYYIFVRFKPSFKQKAYWFVIAAGLVGTHAVKQRLVSSSGGYCNGIAEWQSYAESALVWCALSLTFFIAYRLIIRLNERYRHFLALGAPIGAAIAMLAISFLIVALK